MGKEVVQATADKAEASSKLAGLRPYIEKLKSAEARGLEMDIVEQAGFQELFALERGEATTALCPICMEKAGTESVST